MRFCKGKVLGAKAGLVTAVLMAVTLLAACGGGGGGGGGGTSQPVSSSPAVLAPIAPIAVKVTSYENAKGMNTPPISFPSTANTTRAVADFQQKGQLSLFIATLAYDPSNSATYNNKGKFIFYGKDSAGNWV